MSVAIALNISESTVKYWSAKGTIPEQYWDYFIRIPACSCTIESLYKMNRKNRGR